ncbi:pleiotropic drug resistance protein PDR [Cyberlindnera jadinii NRRL Y-1542]|uniref:Pleiotropic drug resistance protein PDR n=1 Tax=Cyberlindnera jadinii (strain ATCC 18201 / CBS 1600 / BCRC 20928 / JCM 3617 / NBRC 0987 / NRRL Y-1542) TaxID=983966 RepID=A0A1E4RVB4_CYBJN|nr:pleiotropic drug resistance protein PDR [Cyberlindnera jadinii NRRL Y-1542]ODV71141.1 pleiotropic drug resistance protein PDR [Cyberlindnera jadinii NRRL Y-1542]
MSSTEKSSEDSIDTNDGVNTYRGFDADVQEQVQDLARILTNKSYSSSCQNKADSDLLSRVSTVAPGVDPITGLEQLDPRLDPNSSDFSSRYWIKNFRALMDKDPEHYNNYSLGITYKNLRAYGEATDADYQSNVVNAPAKLFGGLYKKYFRTSSAKEKVQFDILKSMDGIIKPGEVVVVLGRPGSGCTTLLKTIASNTHGFDIAPESEITYDGLTPQEVVKSFRGEIVYNAEADIHFPHLTVWQTLYTAAKFRTPENRIPGVSREEFAAALTKVYMATYGLTHTKNTRVGSELVRGVSGGERKRVSIAEVSLAGSKLQCWDNATRGLDAATALEFIRALRTSADVLDTTALIAIYQCSQEAYDLFDKVSVLYEGYQIYFGRGDKAREYFIKMGWDCPQRQTTADFLTSVTSPRERVARKGYESKVPKTGKEFEAYWKASPEYAELMKEIDANLHQTSQSSTKDVILSAKHARQSKNMRKSSPFTVSFPMQVRYLLTREFQRIRNDIFFHAFSVLSNSLMSLVLSSIFYNLQNDTASFYYRGAAMFLAVLFNSFASFLEIMSLFEARPIIEKHKQFALYHPAADALASVISQTPFKMITALFFNLVFYFMVNLRRDPGRFFFYFFVNILATFTMSHAFRLIGSMSNSLAQALVPAHIILLGLVMFLGFTLPTPYMLGWCRWMNYLNPLAYTFEALMANEFHDREFDCTQFIPGNPNEHPEWPSAAWVCDAVGAVAGEYSVSGDAYLSLSYDYSNGHKWRNVGILIAFLVVLLAVYMLFAEFNESAKQKGEVLLFQWSTLRKIKKDKASNDLEAGKERDVTEQNDEGDDVNVEALQAGKDIFHWRDVHYTVKIKTEEREILAGVDGWVKPGTLTALMGASGAGKTTLLDVLASRVTMGVVTGNMFVNGHLRDSSFQRSTGYVQQQDLHLDTATVREALRFSAYLRQPSSVSKKEKDDYVEEVIKILDMQKYADAVVGVAGEGLNVEQRKRLTIGVELAAKPKLLLFFDEPTSGLDSQTAWSICQLMRKLANHGQAILCTIHQPSAILMQEFDRLLFLARGGRTVYFGDLGKNCQTLIDYFESHGSPKCPPEANPAEWMLHVIGAAPGSHANQDYHQVWLESDERKAVLAELDHMEKELVKLPKDESIGNDEFAAPFYKQFWLVTERVFQQTFRTPSYIWSKLCLSIIPSIYIGFVFFNANATMQGLQNQMFSVLMFITIFNPLLQQMLPTYVAARDLYEMRERPSKTFSWKAFMLSEIVSEIPWNALIGTIAFFCWYYPAGFYHNSHSTSEVNQRGAYAWFFCVMFFVYIGTMAHMCIAPIRLEDMAGTIAYLFFTLCITFCGVMVSPDILPGFWIFMYRVSPMTYFVSGYLANAVAHADVICAENEYRVVTPPPGVSSCGEYFESYIEAAGTGYLINPNAADQCQFCPLSSTDDWLHSVGISYGEKWRNLGLLWVYMIFNVVAAIFLYWLARVPKKSGRVKEQASSKPSTQKEKSS